MHIRNYMNADYEEVLDVWKDAGLEINPSDSKEGLRKKLSRDGDAFLVAVDSGKIIGAVIGAYDGRRGWIYHLGVAVSHQGKGIGKELVLEVEKILKSKGCDKIHLMVDNDNIKVVPFYEKLGFSVTEALCMGKWLEV